MTLQLLEAAGAQADDQTGLEGSVAARRALTSGDIDMYWEYTGTAWLSYLQNDEAITDPERQYEAVKKADLAKEDIEWLEPAPFDNTYAIAVREDAGEPLDGVETISDLADLAQSDPDALTFCVGPEFAQRADGLPGLLDAYGFEVPSDNISTVGDAIVYKEVGSGEQCNFGSVFATDGKIGANSLRVLEDDQRFFAVYNPALNVRAEVLEQNPQLAELFNPLAASLETEKMQEMNTAVDAEGELPEDVARQYLEENGFLAG
ncbi:MAG: glycine/betaine ABC transporter substrate-binding protein [Solirubrobacterales bacterium]|nr:glycine/betaine ABC transporter substrate-binding protein [Solirubrobacterales bacterium]